ncbi:MAG: hypothetical protein GWN58_04820 [Anaerolineae bacterium]|nr:hypothetical protein [Anaerolineae bacterium]
MPTDKPQPPVILGRYAGFFSRGAAYVLDRAICFGISFVLTLVINYLLSLFRLDQWLENLSQDAPLTALLALLLSTVGLNLLVNIVYNVGFWTMSGQTPGKRILGVRVMRKDGTRVRLGNALRRQIGYWISGIFYLGFLWILFDNKRQGFHDKIAGTIVTYSWPEGRLRGTFVIERVRRFTGGGSDS